MHPCDGSPIYVYWNAVAVWTQLLLLICLCSGLAPTQVSDWEQRLCLCNHCVPIDINGTACTRIQRLPVYPRMGKHGSLTGYELIFPMSIRPYDDIGTSVAVFRATVTGCTAVVSV